jgi:hypothetical protein
LNWWGTGATVYQTVAEFAHKILCNIHGHTQNFVTGRLGDTQIPRVALPNIDFYRPNTYADMEGYGEAVTHSKVADSAKDTAFCVITVDLSERKLYADHYGAGYDRVVDLDVTEPENPDEESYVNRISTATVTFNGTQIYQSAGYRTSCRINSVFDEIAVNGMCCTGFISVTPGDVIRVKNVTLSGSATSYLVTYTNTGGEYTTLDIGALGQPDANGVYTYTIPASTGAIRLSVGVIDETSVLTINQPIQ